MSPRNKHAQSLYLDPDKADLLDKLAAESRIPKAVLLREAVDDLLAKYPRHVGASDTLAVSIDEGTRLQVGPKIKSTPGAKSRWQRERVERKGAWQQDPTKPAREIQDVDRTKDTKSHIVIDARTGKERLQKVERLSEATGRGSAQRRTPVK